MKIAFWGSDSFAFPSLEMICKNHEIAVVICQPDKESGRNRKVSPPATKTWAMERGIPVLQPEKLKNNPEFLNSFQALDCQLSLVISYGKIIPDVYLKVAPTGFINLHGSLLPKLRGASPIQSSILQGFQKTGLSVQFVSKKMDAGDIIAQREMDIDESWDFGRLREELSQLGSGLLDEVLRMFSGGDVKGVPQRGQDASYVYKILPEHTIIDWDKNSYEIRNKVRAFSPSPGARTWFNGKMVKIWEVNSYTSLDKITEAIPAFQTLETENKNFIPGQIIWARKGNLLVASLDGYLEIVRLQPENKKIMKAQDFINGFRPNIGDSFGSGE